MKSFELFINNEWVPSSTGKRFNSVNPATGEVVSSFASASSEDVRKAVNAAHKAFKSGVWSQLAPQDRLKYMMKAAEIMRRRIDEFALAECLDTGKPLAETRRIDIPISIYTFERQALMACNIIGQVVDCKKELFDAITYEPYGVAGVIAPFNYPLHLLTRGLCPAIAAGNCVVGKPSSLTSTTAMLLGEVIAEAGFPAGVVNLVTGPGSVVGEAIMSSPEVEVVTFTGSEEVGRSLLEQSSRSPIIKKLILELGGKSPLIIDKDCDMSVAIVSSMKGLLLGEGQTCCALTRVLVHEEIYDEFLTKLADAMRNYKIGDPLKPDTKLGSLIDKHQVEIVDSYVKGAVAEGGRVYYGGKPYTEGDCEKGCFYMPTILVDVDNTFKCVREEIFGPVVCVTKYKDMEEAIEMANDTSFGLAAAVCSKNTKTLHDVAKRLDAGTVWLNCSSYSNIETPFGGNKNSGIGRENGMQGLLEYLKTKNTMLYVGNYENYSL